MKCDNCESPAVYCVNDPGTNPVNYCSSCLPVWQHDRAAAGHFPLPESVEAKSKTSKKTSVPVEEAQPVSAEETEAPVSDEDK
jgi:hypothetical protein